MNLSFSNISQKTHPNNHNNSSVEIK
ncbi:unnamed protein product [Spirodela intermedia]|uniref:Uncharacterized protein n=2 Tax=Spirodela intermedia TaxID=51605 RepID=A0A7I8JJL1_SPIIN|nr:unnamed protein product [Spirodela intermedia]CAA6669965.1 unnamed protein product [Spirodela intermedia]CAA7406949.1 unnamed protein product [Spirodela intermedia]